VQPTDESVRSVLVLQGTGPQEEASVEPNMTGKPW